MSFISRSDVDAVVPSFISALTRPDLSTLRNLSADPTPTRGTRAGRFSRPSCFLFFFMCVRETRRRSLSVHLWRRAERRAKRLLLSATWPRARQDQRQHTDQRFTKAEPRQRAVSLSLSACSKKYGRSRCSTHHPHPNQAHVGGLSRYCKVRIDSIMLVTARSESALCSTGGPALEVLPERKTGLLKLAVTVFVVCVCVCVETEHQLFLKK